MRAVVDTNVLISGLIRPRGPIGAIVSRLRDSRFVAVVSPAMLEELVAVLSRPWLREKYGVDDRAVETFLRFLLLRAELVTPRQAIRKSRDPPDDKFLEAAVAGAADRLVTGDGDLLALVTIEETRIVTPAAFVSEID